MPTVTGCTVRKERVLRQGVCGGMACVLTLLKGTCSEDPLNSFNPFYKKIFRVWVGYSGRSLYRKRTEQDGNTT